MARRLWMAFAVLAFLAIADLVYPVGYLESFETTTNASGEFEIPGFGPRFNFGQGRLNKTQPNIRIIDSDLGASIDLFDEDFTFVNQTTHSSLRFPRTMKILDELRARSADSRVDD